jgi:hypothetical protein
MKVFNEPNSALKVFAIPNIKTTTVVVSLYMK